MDDDTERPDDPIPYGRHAVDEDDVEAVAAVLRSDRLTAGPAVDTFERAVADRTGTAHGVAVSSGTAALHAAVRAAGIGEGDEVLVPPMTFAATANAVLFEGGRPVFVDVDPDRLLIDPDRAAEAVTSRTRAILAVDYAGHPCDYDSLRELADDRSLVLIADACHALGATYRGRPVGSLADLSCFSFHPVKPITTAEGGMVVTDDDAAAETMRRFRNHCMDRAHDERDGWEYDVTGLGWNYRLSDLHCALGLSQLPKLDGWLKRRREVAARYDRTLADLDGVAPLDVSADVEHGYHIYVVRVDRAVGGRAEVFKAMRDAGVGVNVHYRPVHMHPYHRNRLGTGPGDCPVTEAAYEEILTLPMHAGLTGDQVDRIVAVLASAVHQAAEGGI